MAMTLREQATAERRGIPRILRPLALAAAVLGFAWACSTERLLDVQDPDIVTPDNLADSTALPTIRATALGDFTLAYSGSGASGSGGIEGQVMTSGLLADEWINSETFPTRVEVDRRGPIAVDNATMQDIFRQLTRARRSAEFGAQKYRDLAPDTTRAPGLAEVLSLAGFTYVFFAENYCSGVPISHADPNTGELRFGTRLTTTQLLDTAINRFDQALVVANLLPAATLADTTTKNRLLRLARVGKARALVDRGDFAAAAATVGGASPVTDFAYVVQHTENTGRENNGVFVGNVISERYSVADREGTNGLPFRTLTDPRTPFERVPSTDVGFDNATPQWDNLRYGDRRAPATLATGAEARLIEAEAFLRAGDPVNFLAKLNGLRAAPPAYLNSTRGGVAPVPVMSNLADPGTATGREDLLFSERARWLWLTGHRLGDLRRLVRQYARSVNTVFPTGAYFKGGFTYGPDVNFPIPVDELNNPNFVQCIDRNP